MVRPPSKQQAGEGAAVKAAANCKAAWSGKASAHPQAQRTGNRALLQLLVESVALRIEPAPVRQRRAQTSEHVAKTRAEPRAPVDWTSPPGGGALDLHPERDVAESVSSLAMPRGALE